MFVELVTLGAFLVICLTVFLVGNRISGGRRVAQSAADAHALAGRTVNEESRQHAKGLKRALAGLVPQSSKEVDRIHRDLKRAGYYRPDALLDYMATRNFLIVCILIVTLALAVLADPSTAAPKLILVGGLVTATLGYGVPRMMLQWQSKTRIERIHRGLPDAMDIVRMSLAAGVPLREAFRRVAQEIRTFHPDIAVEFEIIRRHADADTMPNALRQFASRIDTPDVNALAAIVTQGERTGTHVATAVTDYADSVRLARRQHAEERANKTSIKMLFPVILCLAPPIYILLCGPPVLKLRSFLIDERQPGGILASPDDFSSQASAAPEAGASGGADESQ